MARDIITNASVNISVNGQNATAKLDELRRKTQELSKTITQLEQTGGDKKEIARLRKEFEAASKELKNMVTDAGKVADVMRRLDSASPKELNAALRILKKELNSIERNSDAWHQHAEKIKLVEAELRKCNESIRIAESRWSRMNRWLNDSQTLLAGVAGALTGLVMAARKAVSSFADMDQEMANVRKFTGLSEGKIRELNDAFKSMNTRSSREELNKLAQDAGRLGKQSVEDVLGFVRAADKINVALDDLGDGATLTLSKLTGIFGDESRLGTEKALLAVGSVINELSQNCSASAPYLAEFASRMGGVAAQAGMSVQQVMGLGAVLDSNNQKLEASSTAVSQVIVRIYQDAEKYARVAGLDVSKFASLVKTDMNAALIEFLTALNKAGNMDVLSPMFKDMGENGSRAISALSTLATHIQEVKAQQSEASKAFREAISINTEFNVQNNTVQAGLEKAKNRLNEIAVELGEKLAPAMKYTISSTSVFLKLLSAIVSFIASNAKALATLAAAVIAYHVAVNIATIRTKALTAAQGAAAIGANLWRSALLLANAAVALVTGNTTRATAAFKLFSIAVKANPVGLLVSALTAAAVGIANIITKTDEYKKSVDKAMVSASSFAEDLAKEKSEIDKLFGALEGAKKGTEQYDKARDALASKMGVLITGLINEKGEITSLGVAYDRLTYAAQRAAKARGIARAKENLNQTYFSEIDNLTEKLRSELSKMGMSDGNVERYVSSITQSIALGERIPKETSQAITSFSLGKESLFSFWKGGTPRDIVKKIEEITDDYEKKSKKLDSMEDPMGFAYKSNEDLKKLIKQIQSQYEQTPLQYVMIDGGARLTRKEANNMLKELLYEASVRGLSLEDPKKDKDKNTGGYTPQGGTGKSKDSDDEVEIEVLRLKEEMKRAVAEAKDYISKIPNFKGHFVTSELEKSVMENMSVYDIQIHYLSQMRDLYEKDSKKWVQYDEQIKDASLQKKLGMDKAYLDKLSDMQSKYDELSAEKKFALEKKILDDLLKAKRIDKEEYNRMLESMKRKFFPEEDPKEGEEKPGKEDDPMKKALDELKKNKVSIVGVMAELAASWADLWANMGDSSESNLERISRVASASFAAVSYAMKTAYAFAESNSKIRIKKIEKDYDREIELAQGNARISAQLEKDKQRKISEEKNKASEQSYKMQMIQAAATMVEGAMNAYASALKIPIVGPIVAPVAASVAMAAGAANMALIQKQQEAAKAEGYAEGGYTKPGRRDEPAGTVHAGEWVASQKLLANPAAASVIERLEAAQRTNPASFSVWDSLTETAASSAVYPSISLADADSIAGSHKSAAAFPLIREKNNLDIDKLAETIDRLNKRLNDPFITVNSMTGKGGIEATVNEYKRYRNNARR